MRQTQLQRKVEEPRRVHKQAYIYSSSKEEADSSVEDQDQGQASGSACQVANTEVERTVQSPEAARSSPPPEEPVRKHKGKAKAKSKGKGKGRSKRAHLLKPATELDALICAGKIIVDPTSKGEDSNVKDDQED
ncbi:uncharacterized protein PFL1_06696 [Pseudozyma flocculosa PF-1]|uniref:Uncharacterized protein n=1 Tax=Pseudozyma flocculosa PF-1 TaxID=1277687 RepID=A0A061H0I5_9BASI|nr:uncharacterized protein PFL1_06696 [Pseudozyma flocculosa PF-1]EPQ25702.1 hypothetical protein PFL1_06696 [Pseudozyma flocculosa PF-1]